MVVLDTDHLSLLDRESGVSARRLAARLSAASSEGVATTIVNFEEQMRGWLAYLSRALKRHGCRARKRVGGQV